MKGQHVGKRIVLGTVAIAVAFVVAVGDGRGAGAEQPGGYTYTGGRSHFVKDCGAREGELVDSPKDDILGCVLKDGSYEYCNQKAQNCVTKPPPKKFEPGNWHLADGAQVIVSVVAFEEVAPASGQVTKLDAAPNDHGKHDAKHGKGGKKRGNGGKKGKR